MARENQEELYIGLPEDRSVLFQQAVMQSGGQKGFFIRLATDSANDIFVENSYIAGVKIRESIGASTYIVSLSIVDIDGDLVTANMVEGAFKFYLTIGDDEFDNVTYTLKISKISAANLAEANSSQFIYTLTLISDKWTDFFLKRHNRSWRNLRYSDVVTLLAQEMGFRDYYVTPSDGIIDTIIQPYWTNYELFRWIKRRIVSGGTGGYDFALTVNDGFFFSSYSDLINEETVDVQGTNNGENGTIRYIMRTVSQESFDHGNRSISNIELQQEYMIAMKNGASGVTHSHYDYMNKQYSGKQPLTYEDLNESQLSSWAFISEEDQQLGTNIYTFSDTSSLEVATSKITNASNKIQSLGLVLDYYSESQIGEVIEVQIPLNIDRYSIPFNELLSGFYLVSGKEVSFDPDSNRATTRLKVIRQGVNSQDPKTLVSSLKGRV